jgi:4-amino-4-deoxy-L-arabinose transferase-like glycosyltransferase
LLDRNRYGLSIVAVSQRSHEVGRSMHGWSNQARPADVALLVVVAGLLAWSLVVPPIWTRGEAREALVVGDFVEHGHWVIARRDGDLASKPPLFHWIAGVAALVVGLHDAAVRLPSALAALTLIALTGCLGVRIGGRAVGWTAAAILGGTAYFWSYAVESRVDMVFAAAVSTSLAGFFLWYARGSDRGRRVAHVAVAAAVLTKGPAGAVLPVATIVLFLVWQRELGRLRAFASLPLGAGAAAVVGVWYLSAYWMAGSEFVEVQVVRENVDRLVGTGTFGRSYLRSLKLLGSFATHLFPWNLIVPWAVWRRMRGHPIDAADRFLHAWWITILAVFTAASRTRSVYLLPAYPALALLAARALAPVFPPVARPALAALTIVMLAATQHHRIREAEADPLRRFAERIRPRVAEAATLRATSAVRKNDTLVLSWLLDRQIVRGRPSCDPDTVVLTAGKSVGLLTAAGFRVVDRAGGGRVALLECAAAIP